MISKKSKIFVAGHNGLVGSAIVRRLKDLGYKNIILRCLKLQTGCSQPEAELKKEFGFILSSCLW